MWPASPYDLADAHLCPACFTEVAQPVCPTCGLELGDSRAPRVLRIGRSILQLELERRGYIDAIRKTTAEKAAIAAAERAERAALVAPMGVLASPASPGATAGTVSVAVPLVATAPAPPAAVRSTDAAPPARAESAWPPPSVPPVDLEEKTRAARAPRRRLTVPVLLLMVGVSLVGVAAIFFLVFAWFVWGIAVRAMIIGGITVASMFTASLLRRRGLTATAEGIGALGIVLLGLDAWAVRANDFFGTADADAAVYAGVATLVVGAVCRVWARFSGLRGPDLAGALALPAGVGLLVAGLLPLEAADAALAGLLGAAAGGLAHALPAPLSSSRSGRPGLPERMALAATGVVALVGAALLTLAISEPVVIVFGSVTASVLALAYAWTLRDRSASAELPGARILGAVASSVGVGILGVLGWQLALRTDIGLEPLLVPPLLAVAVAVAVDFVRARFREAGPAATTAAVIGALSIAATAISWWVRASVTIQSTWTTWLTEPFSVPTGTTLQVFLALPVAIAIAALLFLSPTLARPVLADARVVVSAILVLGAAALPAVPALAVGTDFAVVALTLVFLRRRARTAGWMIAGAFGTVTAYAQATATAWLWVVAAMVAALVPVAWRAILRPAGASAVALAVAPVGVAAVTALLAPAPLGALLGVSGAATGAAMALLQWVAVFALAALMIPLERASRAALVFSAHLLILVTLLATFGLAAGSFDASSADATLQSALGEPYFAVLRGCLLLAGLVGVVLLRARVTKEAVVTAAILVAPVLTGTLHAALGAFGIDGAGWAPIVLLTGAVAVVGAGTWAGTRENIVAALPWLRISLEGGAAASALAVVWAVAPEYAWAVWALAALGFACASISRGWVGLATSPDDDVFATSRAGTALAAAPRRLLVWPATASLAAAWWWWLGAGTPDATFPVVTHATPVGVVFVILACVLVRLRRGAEAAVAIALGFVIGLVWLAIDSWNDPAPAAMTVALVAAAAALGVALTPLRRVRPAAPVAATVALIALGTLTLESAFTGATWESLWLLLLVGVAFACGVGFALARPERPSSQLFAEAVPSAAIVAAVVAVLPASAETAVVTIALGLLTALHVVAAALGRLPVAGNVRWTALAGAAVVAALGFAGGGLGQIEAATLPLAGALLAGAALATARRRRLGLEWPAYESIVWLAGLVIATVPSLVAPLDAVRVTTVIGASLAGAVAIGLAPIPPSWRVRTPSSVLLAGTALVMGARALLDASMPGSDAAALVAGLGAIAVAAVLISTARESERHIAPTALTAAATALILAVTLMRLDGALSVTVVTAFVGGVVGVQAAVLLAWRRWRGFAAVLAIGGLLVAGSACAIRFFAFLSVPGFEADFWALIGAAIAVSIALAALRASQERAVALAAGAVFALTTLLVAGAEFALVAVHDSSAALRTVVTMTALTAAGLVGLAWRTRLGPALAIAAGLSGLVFALVATLALGVRPFELVTVPPALGGLAFGAVMLRRRPDTRTWPVLGPWLALLLLPSMLYDFSPSPELWRVVGLGVVALALVVIGAVFKLQAPLVLGSVVLIVHGAAQLWPWITVAYTAVPWWLWLGIGGGLLIFLAATYERRMRQMRTAFVAVASLR